VLNCAMRRAGRPRAKCQGLLGRSSAMRLVVDELSKVAASKDTTLLLTGETGVGKEVACRLVHSLSRPAGIPAGGGRLPGLARESRGESALRT